MTDFNLSASRWIDLDASLGGVALECRKPAALAGSTEPFGFDSPLTHDMRGASVATSRTGIPQMVLVD